MITIMCSCSFARAEQAVDSSGRKIYTSGSSNQSAGKPVYDGKRLGAGNIDLTAHAGESIELRFVLVSDSYVEEDGFYLMTLNCWCWI